MGTTVDSLRQFFLSGETRTYEFRLNALNQLEKLITENSQKFCQALYQDLQKSKLESQISEIQFLIQEIQHTKKNLKSWMNPIHVKSTLSAWPARSEIHFEPKGVILIISPWNYPIQLALSPLIGAIAAGNCSVIKPSELSTASSKLIAELIPQYFPKNYIQVFEGTAEVTTELLKNKFDHIFFTGSTAVGKIIYQAAATQLTPVTLELGGKSPCIVTESADLDLAARRIVWGKFFNAGQTCVAPDYIYVQKNIESIFLEKLKLEVKKQYSENPKNSSDLGRIINSAHFRRLTALLPAQDKIYFGGQTDAESKYISPTILNKINWSDSIMQMEIFGPILPVLTYDDLENILNTLTLKEKPLAAYLFSESINERELFLSKLSFGGGCINDVILHLSNPDLPFGGVGASGIGSYHGHKSFETFSHQKSILIKSSQFDFKFRYPPYSKKTGKIFSALFKLLNFFN